MVDWVMTGAVTNPSGSEVTSLGSFTKAQLDAAVSDGNVVYVGMGVAWSILTGTPTTIAGYGITNAATLTGAEVLSNKTLDNTNTIALKDTLFTLQDDGDATKLGQFQLSGLTAGTTATLTWPNASGTIALLSGATQTFSSSISFSNATNTFGNSVGTGTIGLATGATGSGSTKTVAIGTAGVSGSTTNISLGSSVSGAAGTIVNNFAPQDPVFTVANLPTATAGRRAFISDGSTTFILGLGLTVTGGGANFGPVYADGTNWKYG